jgi:hypothetical protein
VKKYESKKEIPTIFDEKLRTKRNYRVIRADILSNEIPKYDKTDTFASQRAFIRHDSDKLAKVLMMVLEMGDYENIVKEII